MCKTLDESFYFDLEIENLIITTSARVISELLFDLLIGRHLFKRHNLYDIFRSDVFSDTQASVEASNSSDTICLIGAKGEPCLSCASKELIIPKRQLKNSSLRPDSHVKPISLALLLYQKKTMSTIPTSNLLLVNQTTSELSSPEVFDTSYDSFPLRSEKESTKDLRFNIQGPTSHYKQN